MDASSELTSSRRVTAPILAAAKLYALEPLWLGGRGARTMLTATGTGYLTYDGLAVTRWLGDETCDRDGLFIYVRDVDEGQFWSATLEPTIKIPDEYEVELLPNLARYRRLDDGVQVVTEVCLAAEDDVELRRCTLSNLGDRPRTIEVTSYLEWVLQDAAADAAHPAFSKLFVETEHVADLGAVVARRRQRDPKQPVLCGAHWIVQVAANAPANPAQFETNRKAFIGRGRNLRAPAAMTGREPMTGDAGPVLDPIASLRRIVYLAVGESAVITFATTGRADKASLLHAVATLTPSTLAAVISVAAQVAAHTTVAGSRVSERNADSDTNHRIDAPHSVANATQYRRLRGDATEAGEAETSPTEALQFDNGLGGFTAVGDEYVIRLQPDEHGRLKLPPMPWTHVVANPQAGFIATETGAGYTWTANSRENRLTHWSNDPVCDPHSEVFYLRDLERRKFWSPLPGPAGPAVLHEIRYGFGYARYEQTSAGLRQQVLQFVPTEDSLKLSRLLATNESGRPRRLDLFFYARLALGNGARETTRPISTWHDAESGAMFAKNPAREFEHRIAFAALIVSESAESAEFTGDRREFLGAGGDLEAPLAVQSCAKLSGRTGAGMDACIALKQTIELPAAGTAQCWILLGEADTEQEARRLIARYSSAAAIDRAFAEVRKSWQHRLNAVQIETPSIALNLLVNGWLPYQNLSCRLWGRSAYYQSGGAFGFRDQLQDAAALVYHDPTITREQILRHAANQFVEGDVLHWWHPPASRGIRTRFSDDLLWLPLVATEYCATTGDVQLWDELAPYLAGPLLEPGEAERFFTPQPAGESSSIYEHCCRAIDRSLAVGARGLPLIGCGDWNDGMNRIGQAGRGESVWMAFFFYYVLDRMIPACRLRFDEVRATRYQEHQHRLRAALNAEGWDGHWYRRAFFDDGEPVGTASADECQIDALVQAWAVLSGAGDEQKSRQAMEAIERRLVREDVGLIQLLDPPFDRTPRDPGYIKGYLPGVRENGGQYTHGVLWFVRAMAELGRGGRAVALLDMLNPIHHAQTPEQVAVYQAEPYVVAADVYSQPPHVGRAGWTWYTGSAGWMFRVAVESILGLQVRNGRELVLKPCISAKWPECRLRYRLPGRRSCYDVMIENPHGRESGVRAASIDGQAAPIAGGVAIVPFVDDGKDHQVILQL